MNGASQRGRPCGEHAQRHPVQSKARHGNVRARGRRGPASLASWAWCGWMSTVEGRWASGGPRIASRGELVPEVQEAGGKRGSPARPGLPRASEVSVKIRAGSEEGRWECGGRGHWLGALISECGLGPWHRDRGSELLSGASFFQTDEGG